MLITGDFTDDAWLVLVEDSRGMGRVTGYAVYETEQEAEENKRSILFRVLVMGKAQNYITTEIMTYADFRKSYGNRMPLVNRLMKC